MTPTVESAPNNYKWAGHPPWQQLHISATQPRDLTLDFDSCFKSGNLYLEQKVSDQEYDCLMQNDINSKGHTQLFYFRVRNTRQGHSVKFNIQNYSKGNSMFN